MHGDPTQSALIVAARKAGLEAEALDTRFARVAELPFSSERKLMSTVHSDAERRERLLAFMKGFKARVPSCRTAAIEPRRKPPESPTVW